MIVGRRIQIRAIEYEDLPILITWRNDPQVYRFFYEHEPLSMVMQKAWFDRLLQKSDQKFWIAETIEGRQAVGTVGLTDIDWRSRKAELSRVLIASEHQQKGLGSELVCLVMRYFFDHLNLNRLYCNTLVENQRAVKFYCQLGFKQEGVFRQHVSKEGCYCDIACLAMLREDYLCPKTQTKIAQYSG